MPPNPRLATQGRGQRRCGRGAAIREIRDGARFVPLAATGKILPKNEKTTCRLGSSPADRNPANGNSADGSPHGSTAALTVLFGLAAALPATPVFLVLDVPWQAIQLLWILAVIWTIVASFVHALCQAVRHGDRSAFAYAELLRNDDDLDYFSKTGRYAHIRIREQHAQLMRETGCFPCTPLQR